MIFKKLRKEGLVKALAFAPLVLGGVIAISFISGKIADANDVKKYNELTTLVRANFESSLATDTVSNDSVVKEVSNVKTNTSIQDLGGKTLREIHGEVRGIWIDTAYGTDFPKAQYNVDKQKKEMDAILDNIVEQGLNTVYFQVRPFADAFYKSEINPWSKYLTGTTGKDPKWDPLEYMIYAGHQRGLEIHAWLNPFRVTSKLENVDSYLNSLPSGHIATNKDLLIFNESTNDKGVKLTEAYLNPEKAEVKQHVIDTVKELATNYKNLDGIHMDDYFYPAYYPLSEGQTPDGEEANKRRNAVTNVVYALYDAVKSTKKSLEFSISPAAVTKNSVMGTKGGLQNYYDLYADIPKWIKDNKVDVIIPQIYFDKNHNLVKFDTCINYWNNLVEGTNIDLVIGHTLAENKPEVLAEIDTQIKDVRNLSNSIGSSFYGYSNMNSAKEKLNSVYQ